MFFSQTNTLPLGSIILIYPLWIIYLSTSWINVFFLSRSWLRSIIFSLCWAYSSSKSSLSFTILHIFFKTFHKSSFSFRICFAEALFCASTYIINSINTSPETSHNFSLKYKLMIRFHFNPTKFWTFKSLLWT